MVTFGLIRIVAGPFRWLEFSSICASDPLLICYRRSAVTDGGRTRQSLGLITKYKATTLSRWQFRTHSWRGRKWHNGHWSWGSREDITILARNGNANIRWRAI